MPLVSVLIPARNNARYLTRAIRSTRASLPKDSEVVVFDDASTEDLSASIRRIHDRRVRLIRSDLNVGPAAAMRSLLEATDSEFVMRLDSDDVSMRGRFDYQLAELTAGADLSFGALRNFGKGYRGPEYVLQVRVSAPAVRIALLIGNPLGNSTMFARREALGDDAYPDCATEDYATWLRVAARGHALVKSERPLAWYRHHTGQLTKTAKWKDERWNDQAIVREAYARLAEVTLGVTPEPSHPIWGSWAADSAADPDVVAAIRSAIEARPGPERAYLNTLLSVHFPPAG